MSLDNPTPLPPAASESPAAPLDRIELPAEDSLCEMPKGHTVATRVSFKDVLRECEESGPSSDDRAHLQRWADDDRAEEVWHKIERAAQNNKLRLPAKYFIAEILAARRVAMAIGHRGKWREHFLNAADEMKRIAKFLRKPHPHRMPPYPRGTKLAEMLDDAANYFRKQVEPSRNLPGILKFSRQSKAHTVFMSMVGNDLKEITGLWLDEEVGVLTEIAFDSPDIIDAEAARWARRQPAPRRTARKARR
jgi:hypothetical protein